MDSRSSRSSKEVGTSNQSEDFDLADTEKMADNQKKPIAKGTRLAVSSKPIFFSSGSAGSSRTPSSTTNSVTTIYPSFPPFHNTVGINPIMGSLGSSRSSFMDPATQKYNSPTNPSTMSACSSLSSSASFDISSTSNTASGRRTTESTTDDEYLINLKYLDKETRKREKGRLRTQAFRQRQKDDKSDLESNVAQLKAEKAQLESELEQVKSELELLRSTKSISNTCPECEDLHRKMGHNNY